MSPERPTGRRFRRAALDATIDAYLAGARDEEREGTVRFVLAQLERAPTHVRAGLRAVELLLLVVSAVNTGKPLWSVGADRRVVVVRSWSASPLPPVAQYARLLRSLTLFSAHELRYPLPQPSSLA